MRFLVEFPDYSDSAALGMALGDAGFHALVHHSEICDMVQSALPKLRIAPSELKKLENASVQGR